MIIGLNGPKKSGKDTVAAYLIKEYGFERRAIADPIKQSVAALFDIPFSEIDKMKINPKAIVSIDDGKQRHDMTMRLFLQRLGKEASMDIWGENCWNDQILPKNGFYSGRKIVVTDVRFSANARRIHECGGFVVRVERPGVKNDDPHEGEQPLTLKEVDYFINNDSDMQRLYRRVEAMLQRLGELPMREAAHG